MLLESKTERVNYTLKNPARAAPELQWARVSAREELLKERVLQAASPTQHCQQFYAKPAQNPRSFNTFTFGVQLTAVDNRRGKICFGFYARALSSAVL